MVPRNTQHSVGLVFTLYIVVKIFKIEEGRYTIGDAGVGG